MTLSERDTYDQPPTPAPEPEPLSSTKPEVVRIEKDGNDD